MILFWTSSRSRTVLKKPVYFVEQQEWSENRGSNLNSFLHLQYFVLFIVLRKH